MGFGDFAPSLLGELLLLEVGVGLRRVAGLGGGLAGVVDSDLLWAGLVEVGLAVGLPSACGFGNRGGLLRGRDPPPDTSDAVDPADPVLRMASLSSCSSESADLAESNEAALLMAPPEAAAHDPTRRDGDDVAPHHELRGWSRLGGAGRLQRGDGDVIRTAGL